MRKLKIVLDADGVLTQTTERLLELYNAEYNLSFTMEDVTEWDLDKIQAPGTKMKPFFNRPGFFYELQPISDAIETVNALLDQGHEIFIATAVSGDGVMDKERWFREFLPRIPAANVIYIHRKDLLRGDIMLDDGLHNIATSNCEHPVIFEQPWNRVGGIDQQKWCPMNQFARVTNWKEFYMLVQRIAASSPEHQEKAI